jgi:hypothetical protein
MSRNKKVTIIIIAVVTITLIVIGISSCTRNNERRPTSSGVIASGYSSSGYTSCVPPLACGPHYAGYVPPYYMTHPSMILFSPYRSYYTPSFNGRSYTAARTPVGKAPVTSRTPMPYPPGYKPVPGDFQPPTAPAPAASKPAAQPTTPATELPNPRVPKPVEAPQTTPGASKPSTGPVPNPRVPKPVSPPKSNVKAPAKKPTAPRTRTRR